MSRTFKILISNWPRTRKFNRLYTCREGNRFWLLSPQSSVDHALLPIFYALIGQNLAGEFMRKIYAASGNLLTDSWRWQGFVSSCDLFNCLFLLDVPSEIELLTRLFCVIHGWFVYCAFDWEMHRLSKSLEIRCRMALFSKISLLTCPCLRRTKRVEKSQAILAWFDNLQGQHLDWWAIIVFDVFIFRFAEVERSLCGLSFNARVVYNLQ